MQQNQPHVSKIKKSTKTLPVFLAMRNKFNLSLYICDKYSKTMKMWKEITVLNYYADSILAMCQLIFECRLVDY